MRKPKNEFEIKFWDEAYKLGMKNPWASGRADLEDGNPIVEEDRLNRNSCKVAESFEELLEYFRSGNHCLGDAVMYNRLVFINQLNGGSEWRVYKWFNDDVVRDFESISMKEIIDREGVEEFRKTIEELVAAIALAADNSKGYRILWGQIAQ